MKINERSVWSDGLLNPVKKTYAVTHSHMEVHHSAGALADSKRARAALRSIYRMHTGSKGWSDIFYNLLIDTEGNVYSGRGVGKRSQGTALTVCVLGNFETDELPEAVKETLVGINASFGWPVASVDWHGKRAAGTKYASSCPGKGLIAWIKAGMPTTKVGNMVNNEGAVKWAYLNILGRSADDDPVGKAHWIKALEGGYSVQDMRWEFVAVRFAASTAELFALRQAVEAGLPNAAGMARGAYDQFLDGLVAYVKEKG